LVTTLANGDISLRVWLGDCNPRLTATAKELDLAGSRNGGKGE